MSAISAPQRFARWWRPTRFIIAAAAGIVVLVMSFVVHHRQSFNFEDPSRSGCTSCGFPEDLPKVDIDEARLPADQFLTALLDQNWLKVERYLAPPDEDREYLESFKMFPLIQQVVNSDCSSEDVQSLTMTPPLQDSLVFFATAQMKRLCLSPDGRSFNRMLFQVFPIDQEWYYVASTLRLETPRSR